MIQPDVPSVVVTLYDDRSYSCVEYTVMSAVSFVVIWNCAMVRRLAKLRGERYIPRESRSCNSEQSSCWTNQHLRPLTTHNSRLYGTHMLAI
jgi:hypothetical protein